MCDRPSEFELIARLFAPLAAAPGALGLTDDAAVLPARPGCDTVVTVDALVEGVHFLKDDPPDTIARKALRVNLSDLAAKGAEPAGYFLALSLPAHIGTDWLEEFARGLAEDQNRFSVSLMGGDTTSTPGPLTLAVTAVGYTPEGRMIRRAGAQPGDHVFVSGSIGDAGGGLAVLTQGAIETYPEAVRHLIDRYRLPTPRLELGRALRGIASAMLDVSDGLVADLGHIAEVSAVHVAIEAARIPRSDALRERAGDGTEAVLRAATAGDDYELAFTAASEVAVMESAAAAGIKVSRIGAVSHGQGIALLDANGGEIAVARAGFRHF
jgi:thiamine-monophosphate kinase